MSSLKKKAQVIMLPTKHSNLSLYENKLSLAKANHNGIPDKMIPQHLFIVDDSEIKENDYYIHFNTNTKNYILFKADSKFDNGNNPNIIDKRKFIYEYWNKKVIVSTDKLLNLPQPSEQFVQKYVESYNKGNVITEVTVEYEEYMKQGIFNKGDDTHYFDVKINPDNTINIKLIKDSWNREEIEEIIWNYKNYLNTENETVFGDTDKWIKENL